MLSGFLHFYSTGLPSVFHTRKPIAIKPNLRAYVSFHLLFNSYNANCKYKAMNLSIQVTLWATEFSSWTVLTLNSHQCHSGQQPNGLSNTCEMIKSLPSIDILCCNNQGKVDNYGAKVKNSWRNRGSNLLTDVKGLVQRKPSVFYVQAWVKDMRRWTPHTARLTSIIMRSRIRANLNVCLLSHYEEATR